jgi:hypothetical protein
MLKKENFKSYLKNVLGAGAVGGGLVGLGSHLYNLYKGEPIYDPIGSAIGSAVGSAALTGVANAPSALRRHKDINSLQFGKLKKK